MEGKGLSPVDKVIINVLKEANAPLSTYEIAKRAEVSWATTNTHCFKLAFLGLIEGKTEESKIRVLEKKMWWLKKP
jgi:predicted transcriptional regulator